ncbi:MAG: polysaccharide biosynthesis PFTS motif protein, partial [Candidatus Omnitrophica bacterium]|nr:polysaccharide biosynthesis PFTS motif protein [Candidatus Omnitrophota bacterium]
MNKEIIIFEEILPGHHCIIRYYLAKGIKVYFLRANQLCFSKRWFNNLLQIKALEHRPRNFSENFFDGFYEDISYENIDKFFKAAGSDRTINKIKQLYGRDDIDLAFRRVLNRQLPRFYYLNYVLNYFHKRYPDRKVRFVPSNGITPDVYRTDGCEIADYFRYRKIAQRANASLFPAGNVSFPVWAIFNSYFRAGKRAIKAYLKSSGFLFFIFAKKIQAMLTSRGTLKRHYKYAVMIMFPQRQFANRIQKVDFLIDDALIKKDEVLFMSSMKIPAPYRGYLADNRLDYLDNLEQFISWGGILKMLPVYLSIVFSIRTEPVVLETAMHLLYYYLRWEGVAKNIKIGKVISYCDFGVHPIARNIILNKYGSESYFYMDSINSTYFFSKQNSGHKYKHPLWGFLHYDYFIAWNDDIASYFRESKCTFKHYLNLGCFWSEHLRLIKQGIITSDFKNRLSQHGYREGMKLISVFDSSYNEDSLTTYDDGIVFLKGILKLLDDFPEVFMVIKEKRSITAHKKFISESSSKFLEIRDLYTKLENHPRCYGASARDNSSEVIAFTDLTISFPFSSTTFEAFSARSKAIWYDAADKFRGTFYDNVPGLICHSYDELSRRVRQLLFEISQPEYDSYLYNHIKAKI